MSFFASELLNNIEDRARIFYIDRRLTTTWNKHRRGNELRLLTGWSWQAKVGGQSRTGFKTFSAAARDAYYVLVEHREQPADVGKAKVVSLDARRRREAQHRTREAINDTKLQATG